MGVRFLSLRRRPDYAFVLDDEGRTGSFASRALGSLSFRITFKGRAAHAASNPDEGRNAIRAASLFVSGLRLGRSREGDCMNIGTVSGGTFNNVIPAGAVLTGQVRAFEYKRMLRQLARVNKGVRRACEATGCGYVIKANFRRIGYPLNSKDARIMRIAEAAAGRAKVRFSRDDMYASSDANILHRKGYNVIVMRPGYRNPHSPREYTTVKELADCRRLIVAISDEVMAGD